MAKGKLSFKAQETEGVPPPKEVNNWRILLLAIAASFGGLCYGKPDSVFFVVRTLGS